MNCSHPPNRTPGFLCLFLCSLALTCVSQTPPPKTAANQLSSDRFLLILDVSAGMEKRATNAQRIVGQLFSSSLAGQLRRGDTIGAWTFDSELHTGVLPLQRWSAQSAREIPATLVQFVQKQRYSKQPRLEPVMAQLKSVVADSDRITVLLVSDGSASPSGTPFDAQISQAFKLNTDDQKRQAMPFVTVLRAVKGEFVGFKVNTPPWPIEFPAFPPIPIAATPEPTNAPSTNIVTTPPVTPIASSEPKPTSIETNTLPPAITNPPVVVESKPAPAETLSNPPPVAAETSPPPVATNVTPVLPPTQTVTQSAPTKDLPVSSPKSSFPALLIMTGAIALGGLAILCLAFLRRARRSPRVSLITRSMSKDRK